MALTNEDGDYITMMGKYFSMREVIPGQKILLPSDIKKEIEKDGQWEKLLDFMSKRVEADFSDKNYGEDLKSLKFNLDQIDRFGRLT